MLLSAFFIVFGLAAICWLIVTLAVYALPVWIGLSVAFWLHGADRSVLVATVGGVVMAGLVASLGEIGLARLGSVPFRLAIGLVHVVPAGLAGFHAARGRSTLAGTGDVAGLVLSGLGALAVGTAALARLARWSRAGGYADDAGRDVRAATERRDDPRAALDYRVGADERMGAVRPDRRPRQR